MSDTQRANHLPQQVCSFGCTIPMLLTTKEEHGVWCYYGPNYISHKRGLTRSILAMA